MGPPVVRVTPRAGRAVVAAMAAAAVLAGALAGAVGAAGAVGVPRDAGDDRPATSPAEVASARELTPGTGPVSTAVIVPITVPTSAQSTGLIDPDTLATDTGPTGVLTRQLNTVADTTAVLAIDPMIVASIRVLGSAAPASATAWLDALTALPNEKFPLAYADADPGVLARVPGGADLLTDIDLQFDVASANFGPARSPSPTATGRQGGPTPTPTPTATGGPIPLPTNADLLAAPGSWVADDIAWPADGTVASSDIGPLTAAGYHSLLLGSGNVSSVASARVDLGGISGLVSDDGLSGIAKDAVDATGDAALQAALGRLDAALTGMQAVTPGRSVIMTLPRGWSISALHVRELLLNVGVQPSAQTVGLSTLLAGPAVGARLVDGSVPADGAALAAQVVDTVGTESAFATIAGDRAAAITSPRHLELLSTMSVAWVESDSWPGRLRAYLASSAALLAKVKVVPGSSVLVTATSTTIPVSVSNALEVPITVDVTVTPESTSTVLRVTDQRVQLKVEPNATSRAFVPAQALAPATVTATITLHSSAQPTVGIGDPESLEVNLRPSWEGIGTGIFAAVVVLLFGGGIVRQVLKRRRARRAGEAEGATAAGATASAGATPADPAPAAETDPDATPDPAGAPAPTESRPGNPG